MGCLLNVFIVFCVLNVDVVTCDLKYLPISKTVNWCTKNCILQLV